MQRPGLWGMDASDSHSHNLSRGAFDINFTLIHNIHLLITTIRDTYLTIFIHLLELCKDSMYNSRAVARKHREAA